MFLRYIQMSSFSPLSHPFLAPFLRNFCLTNRASAGLLKETNDFPLESNNFTRWCVVRFISTPLLSKVSSNELAFRSSRPFSKHQLQFHRLHHATGKMWNSYRPVALEKLRKISLAKQYNFWKMFQTQLANSPLNTRQVNLTFENFVKINRFLEVTNQKRGNFNSGQNV